MKKTKENNLKKLKLLITIMPHNKRSLFMNIIEQYDCNYHLSFQGMGVATNEIKDMLGLKDTHRDVLFSIIHEDKVKDCLLEIEDKVGLYKSGGIAFSVPFESIIGINNYLFLANLGGKGNGN